MKKYIVFLLCLVSVCFYGCNNNVMPLCVSFTNITKDNSGQNTFIATFINEEDYKSKHTSLMFSSKISNLTFSIAKQNEEFVDVVLPVAGQWYSIEAIIAKANNNEGKEQYKLFKDVSSLTYIIKCNVDTTLKIKAVVGNIEKTSKGGMLLTFKQDISTPFSMEIKKYTKNYNN